MTSLDFLRDFGPEAIRGEQVYCLGCQLIWTTPETWSSAHRDVNAFGCPASSGWEIREQSRLYRGETRPLTGDAERD